MEQFWSAWRDRVPYTAALGMELQEVRPGYARAVLPALEQNQNHLGGIHGGALFTLADTVAGAACLAHGKMATTVDADIHYLAPVAGDCNVICEATEVRQGRTVGVYDVIIHDGAGKSFVKATFTYYILDMPMPVEE